MKTKVTRCVPTVSVLVSKSFSVLLAHALVYPATTVMIRCANKSMEFDQILSVFQSRNEFLSLYRGLGFHLTWTLIYQFCTSINEYNFHYWIVSQPDEEKQTFSFFSGRLLLCFFKMALYPLQAKALFDQAYPMNVNSFSWTMPSLRYYIMLMTELFIK